VASTVTVLRRGRVVAADLPVDTVDEERLGALILGEGEVDGEAGRAWSGAPRSVTSSPAAAAQTPRLSLRRVEARGPRGELALRALDLEVGSGEVLGVAGVSGNGQRELAEVVVGLRAATSGAILVDGAEVSGWSVRRRLDHGIGYVPEDRQRSGVSAGLSVMHNLALRRYRRPPGRALCDWGALAAHAAAQVEAHDIRVASLQQPAGQLSGGNAQKLILAREIDAGPRLLVAAQPTRGLDLGAAAAVRARLAALAQGGCAVLLISEELDELLELAHRVAVLYRGHVAGTLQRDEATPERLGRLMLGQEASL
jgi:simple sugar transport system ATP-binding protein